MPIWRNSPSMPKVRLSSGTIGTMRGPIVLSRSSVVRMRTKAIVVEISRPSAVAWSSASNADNGGTPSGVLTRRGQRPTERRAPLPQIAHSLAVRREGQERDLRDIFVGDRDLKAIAEGFERVIAELLLLVGDHLTLTRLAHAIAFHGLREDDG